MEQLSENQSIKKSSTQPMFNRKRAKKWIIPILSSLLFLSLAANAFLFYQNYQLNQQIRQKQDVTPTPVLTITPTSTPISTLSPTSTPVVGWKTYKNEKYGFEVQYPPIFELSDEPKAPDPELLSFRGLIKGDFVIISFSVRIIDTSASWEALAGQKAQNIQIDELNAKKIEWVERGLSGGTYDQFNQKIIIGKNNLFYAISFYYDNNSPQKEEMLGVFNQVLSTFKFVEQECPEGQVLKQCKLGPCCCPIGAFCD